MKAILTPDISPALGLVIFKPNRDLLPLFEQGRVLISPVPDTLKSVNSGEVPVIPQPLIDNPGLQSFFMSEPVMNHAGGLAMLTESLKFTVGDVCQATEEDEDKYHYHRFCSLQTDCGPVWVCHHCDNRYRENGATDALRERAKRQRIEWVVMRIRQILRKEPDHVLSMQELCWWAFSAGIANMIPEYLVMEASGIYCNDRTVKPVYKESDIVVEDYSENPTHKRHLVKLCEQAIRQEH